MGNEKYLSVLFVIKGHLYSYFISLQKHFKCCYVTQRNYKASDFILCTYSKKVVHPVSSLLVARSPLLPW